MFRKRASWLVWLVPRGVFQTLLNEDFRWPIDSPEPLLAVMLHRPQWARLSDFEGKIRGSLIDIPKARRGSAEASGAPSLSRQYPGDGGWER